MTSAGHGFDFDQKRASPEGRGTVLVIGATGYIGRFAIARLKNAGYRVRVVARERNRAEAPGAHQAPALRALVDEWVITPDPLRTVDASVLEGVDHVFSALGVTRQKADPWDIDFRLNLKFLQLAEQQEVGSFLYVGLMAAEAGTSAAARAKHAFMQVLRRSAVVSQIVNPSGYFSDLTEIFDLAKRGVGLGLGEGGTRLSPIHGADLARFCVDKLDGERGIWDVGGPQVLTYRDVVDLAFAAAGTAPRYLRIPPGIETPAVWVADRLGPRASSLTRFFFEGLQTDSAATPYGVRTLDEYFAQLAQGGR